MNGFTENRDAFSVTGSNVWRLVWSDEFDCDGLPDPKKWVEEVGFVRNREEQYYTENRLENARVENGCLVIEARKEQFPNPAYIPDSDDWRKAQFANVTSASLTTKGLAGWQYGRVEVMAKIPAGRGTWPAIWMLGTNITEKGWPVCGEIDIMENVGKEPDNIYATVHFSPAKDVKHSSKGGKTAADKPWDGFHMYAVEWNSEKMDFFYDDRLYFTFSLADSDFYGDNPFRKEFYLLINLAIGGAWGGEVDSSIFPAKYLIDYVRVFEAVKQ